MRQGLKGVLLATLMLLCMAGMGWAGSVISMDRLIVRDRVPISLPLRDSDIAESREEAFLREPILEARLADYSALGRGEESKDCRMVIQLDPTQLTQDAPKKGWVKLLHSLSTTGWESLYYIDTTSLASATKVQIDWTVPQDKFKRVVAHEDVHSSAIFAKLSDEIFEPKFSDVRFKDVISGKKVTL